MIKMRTLFRFYMLLLFLGSSLGITAQTKIYYVSPTGVGDGTSWETTTTLQTALQNAVAGDQIWVQGFEQITSADQLYIAPADGFSLKSGVQLYGGFKGDETNVNSRETLGKPYQMKYRSVLSGDIKRDDVVDNTNLIFPANTTRSDNATHVLNVNMAPASGNNKNTSPTIINGFSIGNGHADGSGEKGGGIYIHGDNTGGGIFRIERCFLLNNYATQGGAIYVDVEVKNVNNSTSLVNQCVVYNNAAGERAAVENAGGGLYLAGEATVVNSSIFNNENGGLRLADGAKVVNSTVSRNSSGGIDMINDKAEEYNVANTIIWGNSTLSTQYRPKFKNSAFHEVEAGDSDGNIYVTAENRGDTNAPMFDAPSLKTSYDRDFNWRQTAYPLWSWNVLEGSVMLSKGDQQSYDQSAYGSEDMAGNPRFNGSTIDIGAYEFQQMLSTRIRYVKPVATGTGDGSSWENASGNLQNMIDELAKNNPQNLPGEVWVAAGTYVPQVQVISGTTYSASFLMRDGISVYGGFAGDESSKQEREVGKMPWNFVNKTILEGSYYEHSKTSWNESNHKWTLTSDSRHVVFFSPLPSEGKSGFGKSTILNGVTIRGGYAQGGEGVADFMTDRGAGVYMGINATLEKCIVTENSSTGNGGAVYMYGGRVMNSLIYNNNADGDGGAVYVDNAGIVLASMLTNNSANNGSGAYLAHTGNWTDGKPHPEYLILSTSVVSNNTSRLNGAVYCAKGGVLMQNTITNNDCPTATDNTSANASQSGGLYVDSYGLVINSVLWNNTIQKRNIPMYAKNPTPSNVRFLYTALSGINNAVWNNVLQQEVISLAESNNIAEEGVLSPDFVAEGLPESTGVTGLLEDVNYFWQPVTGANLRARGMTLGTFPDDVLVAPEIDIAGTRFAQKPAVGAYSVEATNINPEDTGDALKVYVDVECAVATHDGSSWANGYRSLNEAIAYLSGLDKETVGNKRLEVHVMEGDIWPRYAFTNLDPQTATIDIPASASGATLYIYGGYHRSDDKISVERNPLTYRSVINGNHEGKNIEDGLYHCITVAKGAAVCLDGFHIINGYAAGEASRQYGAGLLVHDGANVTVNNCIFENNTAQEGSAIDARNASLTMNNCVVNNNTNITETAAVVNGNGANLKMNFVTIVNNNGKAYSDNASLISSFSTANTSANTHTIEISTAQFSNPTKTSGASLGFDTYLGGYSSFQPTNQNPIVNVGKTIGGITTDITLSARSRGGAPDLGAYEAQLPVDGTVIYVRSENGDDKNDGLSWSSAKKTITAALNTASTATEAIWVAAGTYNERVTMKDGVNVLGGFAKTGNPDNKLDGVNRDISNANSNFMTVIDGQSGGRVLTQPANFNKLTTWEELVIQNGFTKGDNVDSNGAGVKLMSNGKLKNSLVQNNTHTNTYSSWGSDTKSIGGGGISMSAGSIVDGCIIKANKANKENNDRYTCGAGIHMNGGTLINSIVVDNVATSVGSGLLAWGSNILGAAVFINNAGTFYNCTFAYNYGNTNGKSAVVGGVWDDSKNSKFYNCIFWGNAGNGDGGENTIQVGGPGYSDGGTEAAANKNLINCYASIAEISQTTSELWNNPDATFQMNIGSNDYNQMISKAKANQPFDDNYKLLNNTTGLHCINKGNNIYVEDNDIYVDAAGVTRIQYCTVDKGAYESADAIQIEPDENGVYYVTQNGAGTSDGSSLENASCAMELQRVLNAAGERAKTGMDAIVKIAGYESASFVYNANTLSNQDDPQSYTYVIPYGVTVMGGFSDKDGNWDDDSDGYKRDPITYKTVLSAINNSSSLEQKVNGYHTVTFGEKPSDWNGNDKKSIIDGIYLIDGKATSMAGNGNPNTRGGGAVVPSWAHVRNCVVARCEAIEGGGLYVLPGGVVSGSLIMDNTAENGAGVYADNTNAGKDSRAHMVSCTVTDNTASSIGGGLFLEDGAMMVTNSILWGNTAPSDKNISGVLTEALEDDVWSSVEHGISAFYPVNHSFVETYEMPSNFENTTMESNEDLYFASSSRLLKAYSPLIKHGMDTEYQDAMASRLGISSVDMQGISRIQADMPRIDAGAFAFEGGTIPTDVLLTRIFVSQGANVQLPEGEDMDKYIGRSFYTSLTWLDDALEYIKAVRENGVAKETDRFEILLAGGTYKPSYRRMDASTETVDQRQNSYVIPQGVSIYGGFNGTEQITSKSADGQDIVSIPGVTGSFTCMGDISEILSNRAYSDFNQNGINEPWELASQVILSGNVNVSEQVKNVYHVVYSDAKENQEPLNPVILDGLTIMDGETSNILSNAADTDEIGRGGGIYSNGVSYLLNRCRLINNFAVRGGAVYMRDAKLTIVNSILAGNGTVDNAQPVVPTQLPRGGAVYVAGVSDAPKVYAGLYAVNTLWVNNETVGQGGAIGTNYADGIIGPNYVPEVSLMNNTFVRNKAQSNAGEYATQYMGYKDYMDTYLRYAGPLKEDGTSADKPIDIGLYEYQYEITFPQMDAIYVATVESGKADGSNWANATSDLRGALTAMANPTGGTVKDKAVYIKAGEYSLPRMSTGTAFTVSMGDTQYGESLNVKGSYNESGVQDFSKPTVITTQESNADVTSLLMDVAANNKPVTIEGLTFINKNSNGGTGMQASTGGGKVTLKNAGFRGNKANGLNIVSGSSGKILLINTLFADGGTGLNGADSRTTVVNATFANNKTDLTTSASVPSVYNSVSWNNDTQNLTTDDYNKNVAITRGVANDNVNEGPNFRDPDNADVYNRDYRIRPSVKLLNKGSNANYAEQALAAETIPAEEKDLGNNQRVVDGSVDVGAYEYEAPLQPIVYVKADLTATADGKSWETALGDLQGAVDLAGLYALGHSGQNGYVFVHGNYHDTGLLNMSLGNTKVYGSMNDERSAETETDRIVSDLLGKRKGMLVAASRSSLENVTIGADGVIDGFEITGKPVVNAGVLSTSIVNNGVEGAAGGLLYNSLVLGSVNAVKAVNVTSAEAINGAAGSGNNRASVAETNSYVTDDYWEYQLMETSQDIDPTGNRTDISEYIMKVGHERDLIGNRRIRNAVDNGCFETWNISSDYAITADDYPVGRSVVYVRKGQELSVKAGVYPNGNAFNPGYLLLEHQAGLRGNGNYISLTNFAVERDVTVNGNDLAVMPFEVKHMSPLSGYNLKRYSGQMRAAYSYQYDGSDGKAWTDGGFAQIGTTEGFLIENTSNDNITVRFSGKQYSEGGADKSVVLYKWNYNEPWNSSSSAGNKFTHKENMSWNLFGSPYLCAMNYGDMEYGRVIYGYTEGAYKTINTAGETAGGYIPAGDAVFTQTATLKDAEIIGIKTSEQKDGVPYAAAANLTVGLRQAGATRAAGADKTDVLQLNAVPENEARNYFDIASDGVKWMAADSVAQLYAARSGARYSLLSAVSQGGEVAVGVTLPEPGMYTFYIPETCDAGNYESVVLKDAKTGKQTNLLDGGYDFTSVEGGDISGRFTISFNHMLDDDKNADIRAWSPLRDRVSVSGVEAGDRIAVYSADGVQAASCVASSSVENIQASVSGVAVVEITRDGRTIAVRKVKMK